MSPFNFVVAFLLCNLVATHINCSPTRQKRDISFPDLVKNLTANQFLGKVNAVQDTTPSNDSEQNTSDPTRRTFCPFRYEFVDRGENEIPR